MSVENLFRQPLALNVADATTSVRVFDVADSPDGALVATQGSLALNRFPAQLWQNVDGLATWSLLATLDTPLGGDLTGTLDHAWVTGIQGVPIDAAAPVNGDVLIYNGASVQWEHTSLTFGGGPPSGPAGGDLDGLYPNPTLVTMGAAGTYGSNATVPVLTTDAQGRVTGVVDTPIAFPSAAYPKLGHVAVVDAVNGNDATAAINGAPFLTIPAAIAAINTALATYITIWVLPGSYALSAGLAIPATCALRGMNTQTVRISWDATVPGGTATLLTLSENTRIEDVTLSLTSTDATTHLVGISAPDTTMNTCKLRTLTLSVNNAGVATGSTTTVTGILSSGTSSITPAEFSANFTRGVTISVLSNGGGKKRAILVSGPNAVSLRDTNFYVAAPADPASAGSYVAAETDDNLAQAAFRSCSLSGPTTAGGYTGSDVLQTRPAARDTYGISIGPGTDLIHRTTQGKPFALTTTPAILTYAINAALTGGTRYLWPGVLPSGGDATPVWFRLDRTMVVQGLSINMLTASGASHDVTFTVYKKKITGVIEATDMVVQIFNDDTTGVDLTHAVTFAAGEYIALMTERNGGSARDILVQVDIY